MKHSPVCSEGKEKRKGRGFQTKQEKSQASEKKKKKKKKKEKKKEGWGLKMGNIFQKSYGRGKAPTIASCTLSLLPPPSGGGEKEKEREGGNGGVVRLVVEAHESENFQSLYYRIGVVMLPGELDGMFFVVVVVVVVGCCESFFFFFLEIHSSSFIQLIPLSLFLSLFFFFFFPSFLLQSQKNIKSLAPLLTKPKEKK